MRIWNALNDETGFPYLFAVSVVKAHLFSYCKQSLCQAYDPGVTRLFKPICTICIKLANGEGTKTAAIKLHMNCYCNFYVVSLCSESAI